ncbi:uncharacterized protein LOC127774241 [Oryza glaberrima]|uniref:uncharacterized protein LOC127774241 n=1 Tax=Oryza glaberrima TaxID=4538 RepID=UPI00224C246A|nr:uncharacterized protein LOC127774241 [Oryza glaberrima]
MAPAAVAAAEAGSKVAGGGDVVAAWERDAEKLEFIEEMTRGFYAVQERVLAAILARNNGTEYLRRHSMEGRTDREAFKGCTAWKDAPTRTSARRSSAPPTATARTSSPPTHHRVPHQIMFCCFENRKLGAEEEARSGRWTATVSALLAGCNLFLSPCALVGEEGSPGGRERRTRRSLLSRIDGQKAQGPTVRTMSRYFGPAQARHGPTEVGPVPARPNHQVMPGPSTGTLGRASTTGPARHDGPAARPDTHKKNRGVKYTYYMPWTKE